MTPNLTLSRQSWSAKRRQRFRATFLTGIDSVVVGSFLAVYWVLHLVGGWIVFYFLAYSVLSSTLFLVCIGSGWSERLSDPSMAAIQTAASCARDLLGCILVPGLWFIFTFNLCIAFALGSLQLTNRTFTSLWLLACLALGIVLAEFPDELQIRFSSRAERFALWAFISSTLCRLMIFNTRIASLRKNLRSRSSEIAHLSLQLNRQLDRQRVARELNDTLVQSFLGLIYRLSALTQNLPEESSLREKFDAALRTANQAAEEGRDKVFGLRHSQITDRSFLGALQEAGESYAHESGISFHMLAASAEQHITDSSRTIVEAILLEALWNAFHHGRGRNVWLDVKFTKKEFFAEVRDDGPAVAVDMNQTGQPRYFGVAMMHARATSIGASVVIDQSPEGGTRVALRVAMARGCQRDSWLR